MVDDKKILKSEGWDVNPKNGKFYASRHEVEVHFPFDTEERAWEWVRTFVNRVSFGNCDKTN
jgi:hypothetical protein